MDDYDDFGGRYDVPGAFEPTDDFDREPTPALLAAKAEPLSDAPAAARRPRKPSSANRTKATQAAQASKARSASRRKPKEPSKLLLGGGILAVLLAGFATAYFLTRGGDDAPGDDLAAEGDQGAEVTAPADTTGGADDSTAATQAAEPTGPPTVAFNEAAIGPIEAGVPYTLGVQDSPPDATYQLLIDDVPTGEPAAELPPTTFEPGRHLLVININSPAGATSTGPVLVYALSPTPEASWRANLSSVNVEAEGWGEAVTRYDAFVEAGHTNLQLLPSDRVPALAQGYWNIFVGGFPDSDAAKAYCEQFGLSVPDQCFAVFADPNAPAGG
ncbi:MAG: hypothetical protein ACR2QO_25400 [Acidimicrobiales bacterium]